MATTPTIPDTCQTVAAQSAATYATAKELSRRATTQPGRFTTPEFESLIDAKNDLHAALAAVEQSLTTLVAYRDRP